MVKNVGIYRDSRNKRRPWVCRWYGEYNPQTSKHRRYVKSFEKKHEAEDFAREKATEFVQGACRDEPKEVMLGEFCKDWLKTKKPQLRPGTILLYKNTIKRLQDYFGPKLDFCHFFRLLNDGSRIHWHNG